HAWTGLSAAPARCAGAPTAHRGSGDGNVRAMAPSRATGRQRPPALSDNAAVAGQKRAAARAAAEMVEDGMRLGLGTGSTAAYLLEALGERKGELGGLRCAATSPATAEAARALGLAVHSLDELVELDLAIDGADQIDPAGWLVKGRGRGPPPP